MTMEEGIKNLELVPELLNKVEELLEQMRNMKQFTIKSMVDLSIFLEVSRATAYKLIDDGKLSKDYHYVVQEGQKVWNMNRLMEFKLKYTKGAHRVENNILDRLNFLRGA